MSWIPIAAIFVIVAAFVTLLFGCRATSQSDQDLDAKNYWCQCRRCRRWYNGLGEIRWFQEDGFDKRNQGQCPECTGEFQNN